MFKTIIYAAICVVVGGVLSDGRAVAMDSEEDLKEWQAAYCKWQNIEDSTPDGLLIDDFGKDKDDCFLKARLGLIVGSKMFSNPLYTPTWIKTRLLIHDDHEGHRSECKIVAVKFPFDEFTDSETQSFYLKPSPGASGPSQELINKIDANIRLECTEFISEITDGGTVWRQL